MSDVLTDLRDAVINSKPIELLPAESANDIKTAKELLIDNSKKYELNLITNFITKDNKAHNLRSIYNAYLHYLKNSSTTEYIDDCEKMNIDVVTFLERTDFISWLTGASSECDFINMDSDKDSKKRALSEAKKSDEKVSSSTQGKAGDKSEGNDNEDGSSKKKRKPLSPLMQEIASNEKTLIDHNKALRGNKLIDFSSVAQECQRRILNPIKQQEAIDARNERGASSGSKSATNGSSSSSKSKNNEPIIILSPSASAMINMGNVKSFLENGKFIVNSEPTSTNGVHLLKIQRKSRLFQKTITFLVVNNVEKFFTKDEHWDRVACIFTTGQEWQFKNYKYREPNALFQRYKGFYVNYKGDSVPRNVQSWNVQVIEVERNQRFRDRQTSELLWESLEKFMMSRGYK